jgi:hypothetical protein
VATLGLDCRYKMHLWMYLPSRAMLCRMVSDSGDSPLEPASIEPLSASIEKVKAPGASTEASAG